MCKDVKEIKDTKHQAPHRHKCCLPEVKSYLTLARPESIAGGNEDPELVLDEPEADLGEVGGLAHAVHAAEGHHVRPPARFRLPSIRQVM